MTAPEAPPPDARRDAKIERCQRMVDAMLDVGMKLLRGLDPDSATTSGRDTALAFCRLSQALRLTILLDLRLDDIAAGGSLAPAAKAPRAGASTAEADQDEDQAEAAERPEAAESARGDRERGDPDEIGRALSLPITELAAVVCRDLGLTADQTREALAAFADLAANDLGREAATVDPHPGAEAPPAGAPGRAVRAAPARRRDALGP